MIVAYAISSTAIPSQASGMCFLCCAERSNFSANVNVEAYPPKSVLLRTRAKEPGTLASVLGRTDLKDAENHTDMKTVYINPNRSLDC